MAKTTRASRAQSYFPVKIPIYSLSGGVGRQIPSKRLPTEEMSLSTSNVQRNLLLQRGMVLKLWGISF
jgi:hypothetical protein